MTELEKLRLELVELKLENLIESRSDFGSWSFATQKENSERIKQIEEIFRRIPKHLIDKEKSNLSKVSGND